MKMKNKAFKKYPRNLFNRKHDYPTEECDYYFAYGSNLNLYQMGMRCPEAEPARAFTLHGWRLVFRGVADVEEQADSYVKGALYKITESCQRSLDSYEGFPRLYRKDFIRDWKLGRVMFYTMNITTYELPTKPYATSILEGYEDWNIDIKHLIHSLNETRSLRTMEAG